MSAVINRRIKAIEMQKAVIVAAVMAVLTFLAAFAAVNYGIGKG